VDLSAGSYTGEDTIYDAEIVGGGLVWEGPDAHVTWKFRSPYMIAPGVQAGLANDPFFDHFEIDVCTGGTNTALNTFTSLTPTFVITRDWMNTVSGGQAARKYRVKLYAVDTAGDRS